MAVTYYVTSQFLRSLFFSPGLFRILSSHKFDCTIAYQSITCTICTRLHLVDPKTGRVLGADED